MKEIGQTMCIGGMIVALITAMAYLGIRYDFLVSLGALAVVLVVTGLALVLLSRKKVKYVNVYDNKLYDTKEEALLNAHNGNGDYIKTIKVELE